MKRICSLALLLVVVAGIAKAHGGASTKVLATYVIEKGKPLANPAP